MRIVYKDGGVLECCTVFIENGAVIADDIYLVNAEDIDRIEESEG